MISRRDFVNSASVAAIYSAGACVSIRAYAQEVNHPLGLQLFSVREMLPGDFDGTLQKIGSLGYREVEAAGFYQHKAQGVKGSMQINLKCVRGHCSSDALHKDFQSILDFPKELGAEYIICSRLALARRRLEETEELLPWMICGGMQTSSTRSEPRQVP